MTAEEIKERYSMREIATRYGLEANRAGFIRCPFHQGDRTPSLKLYEKTYHCFACGANGDIFHFVEQMEHINFKEAFMILGGTYQKQSSFSAKLSIYKSQKAAEARKKEQEILKRKKELNNMLIDIYRDYLEKYEPLSDAWCETYNALQKQLYLHEYLNEERRETS